MSGEVLGIQFFDLVEIVGEIMEVFSRSNASASEHMTIIIQSSVIVEMVFSKKSLFVLGC